MHIFPYKSSSISSKLLAKELGIKRIRTQDSKFKGGVHRKVINWGCSLLPDEVRQCDVFNLPHVVEIASNKLTFFTEVSKYDVSIPEWTTSRDVALSWLDNGIVVCRTILNGHSGAGIVLASNELGLVDAPLYVRYVSKKEEYRVHLGDGAMTIIDIQKKAKRKDIPKDVVNYQVRNHANGFIYMRENINLPKQALTYAQTCVKMLGLNFGAVDVIWNDKKQKAYVLEVNTAPGIVGTTLQNYANYFRKFK